MGGSGNGAGAPTRLTAAAKPVPTPRISVGRTYNLAWPELQVEPAGAGTRGGPDEARTVSLAACLFSPIMGLLVADYFRVRKRKIDLRSAYGLAGSDSYRSHCHQAQPCCGRSTAVTAPGRHPASHGRRAGPGRERGCA